MFKRLVKDTILVKGLYFSCFSKTFYGSVEISATLVSFLMQVATNCTFCWRGILAPQQETEFLSSIVAGLSGKKYAILYAILLFRNSQVVRVSCCECLGRTTDRAPSTICWPDRRRNVLSLDCQSAFYRGCY